MSKSNKKIRYSYANPEFIKNIFSKIETTKNKRFKDSMLSYEIFINFKAVFLKDFKVEDENYPKLETDES